MPDKEKIGNEELLAWIDSRRDGVTIREIRKFLGWTARTSSKRLTRLKQAGMLTNAGDMMYSRWTTPRHVESCEQAIAEYRAQCEQAGREKVRVRERLRSRERKRKWKRPTAPIKKAGPDSWPMKKILVSAANAAPIQKLGPASVWELAA